MIAWARSWIRFWRALHAEWRRRDDPPFSDRQPVPDNPSSDDPAGARSPRCSAPPEAPGRPGASGYGGAAQGTGNGAAGPQLNDRDCEQLGTLAGHLAGLGAPAENNGRQLADVLRQRTAESDTGIAVLLLEILNYALDIMESCDASGHPGDEFRVLTDALGLAAVDLTYLDRLDVS